MAQQTAVEWLIEKLEGDDSKIARVIGLKEYNTITKQAKQMEKERIMKTYNDGYRDGMTDHGDKSKDISEFDNARLYYDEIYGK